MSIRLCAFVVEVVGVDDVAFELVAVLAAGDSAVLVVDSIF